MFTCTGYAAGGATGPLAPFSRRNPGPTDVVIGILYCCAYHSDLHTIRNEGGTPISALGHEIVGRVSAAGDEVTRFKIGDMAAVGCMVDSC